MHPLPSPRPRNAARALPGLLLACLAGLGCDDAGPADAEPDAGLPRVGDLQALAGTLQPLVLGTWGSGPDDVWFVGGLLSPGTRGRFIAHFDGAEVRPELAPPGAALWWTWGDGAGRVWACGEEGRILVREADGWREQATGLDEKAVLWGLWGSGPDDLWAVGGSVRRGGPKGLVLRSRGDGVWRAVSDPEIPLDLNLYKVWGAGADEVFLVGEGGTTVRYDGAFHRHRAPVPDLLFTVHGRDDLVLAVGGLDAGAVVRWDGAAWVDDGAPVVPALNGVFVQGDGTARAVGARGTVIERDRAGAWRVLAHPREAGLSSFTLHAIWGAAPGATWAVGGDLGVGEGGVIATARRPIPPLEAP